MKKYLFLVIFFTLIISGYSAGLTYTFANGQITGSNPTFYEFDVLVAADETESRLGDTQVYISYDVLGFGSDIASNSKISVTKGILLDGELVPGSGLYLYTVVNVIDNSSSKVSITTGYNYDTAPTSANLVPDVPTQLMHVSIEIADSMQYAGLMFDQSLMFDNQYESNNSTKYNPVDASDQDDSPLKRIPSAIEIADNKSMPAVFELKQNYPNPFNPTTTISLSLPALSEPLHTEITLYNSMGQKVRDLFSGKLYSGLHLFNWDGKDNLGRDVASGSYIYRIHSNVFSDAKRMVLIR